MGDDDEMSLAVLAKARGASKNDPPTNDDDTPLASFAKAASGRPAVQGGLPQQDKALKRKWSSVGGGARPGSSSSSSSSSSTGSDNKPLLKKNQPTLAERKKALATNKKFLARQTTAGTDDQQQQDDGGGAVRKRERSVKEEVVAALLCRWWYSDDYVEKGWPPQDEEYYLNELEKRRLRKVTIQEWEWVPEEDGDGRKKVYELSQFRGVFRNSEGDLVDCRPQDSCPCFNNLIKKDIALLCQMLVSAYENQLKDLVNCRYPSEKLEHDIKCQIVKTKALLQKSTDQTK